ncbi:MAG: ATP-binding cassette domain-containing protein, partial [Limnobacter sp.]|nr:ATP-binding cassette domain-containing protein [Limnobacter sp.]
MLTQVSSTELLFQLDSLQAGGVELAHDVSFNVLAGSITVLSGPNGSGKSTLLNQFANQVCSGALVYRPSFGVRPELTVAEQAQVFASNLGQSDFQWHDLLEQIDLLEWADEKVRSLSSGQKARLGMVALLVSPAPVWLLDEPLNALDYSSLMLLTRLLKMHLAKGGFVLLVSHLGQKVLANALADIPFREFVLSNGSLDGPPWNQPVHQTKTLAPQTQPAASLAALIHREVRLTLASAGSLLWSGLFLFMVLAFFGLVIREPNAQSSLAVVWMGVILCCILSAKDWFSADYECGWMRLFGGLAPAGQGVYWLTKSLVTVVALWLMVIPVAFTGALFTGLPLSSIPGLSVALLAGIAAIVPLLALVSIMVL